MKRKDFLIIPLAILVCLIGGFVLLVVSMLILIPGLISPKLIPDPRPAITGRFTKFGMRQMMKGVRA